MLTVNNHIAAIS